MEEMDDRFAFPLLVGVHDIVPPFGFVVGLHLAVQLLLDSDVRECCKKTFEILLLSIYIFSY